MSPTGAGRLTSSHFLNAPPPHSFFSGPRRSLRATVALFKEIKGFLESEIEESYPLQSYTQVFLPANLAVCPSPGFTTAYGAAFFSEAMLLTRRSGLEAADTHLAAAGAMARQWFGVRLRPATPEDNWLLEGLAELVTWRVAKQLLGVQEAGWRRRQQADAVVEADTGALLPLAEAWSGAHRHMFADSARLYCWKAGYVMGILERRLNAEALTNVVLCAPLSVATDSKPLAPLCWDVQRRRRIIASVTGRALADAACRVPQNPLCAVLQGVLLQRAVAERGP